MSGVYDFTIGDDARLRFTGNPAGTARLDSLPVFDPLGPVRADGTMPQSCGHGTAAGRA